MTRTFAQRLKACQRGGNLTVADLARWFERSYQTVRSWCGGCEPSGGPIDKQHVADLLKLLEGKIKRKEGFPLPRLSPKERVKHLARIKAKR